MADTRPPAQREDGALDQSVPQQRIRHQSAGVERDFDVGVCKRANFVCNQLIAQVARGDRSRWLGAGRSLGDLEGRRRCTRCSPPRRPPPRCAPGC